MLPEQALQSQRTAIDTAGDVLKQCNGLIAVLVLVYGIARSVLIHCLCIAIFRYTLKFLWEVIQEIKRGLTRKPGLTRNSVQDFTTKIISPDYYRSLHRHFIPSSAVF